MDQSHYPNAEPGNGGQNPVGYNARQPQAPYNPYGAPRSQQNMYGYGYGNPNPVPYAAPAYQPAHTGGSVARRPYALAGWRFSRCLFRWRY